MKIRYNEIKKLFYSFDHYLRTLANGPYLMPPNNKESLVAKQKTEKSTRIFMGNSYRMS